MVNNILTMYFCITHYIHLSLSVGREGMNITIKEYKAIELMYMKNDQIKSIWGTTEIYKIKKMLPVPCTPSKQLLVFLTTRLGTY